MNEGGNTVPRITKAEHIGPDDTGDNIEAKRVANYVWNGSSWERDTGSGGSSNTGGATSEIQQQQTDILNTIASAVGAVAHAAGTAADIRVTLLGGTTAVTGTLTAVTTVTTVTTVASLTNMVNIGSQPATTVIPSLNNTTAILSNINNVV